MSHPNTYKRKIISLAVLSALGASHQILAEETAAEKIITTPVVVTATRTEQNSFDLPVSIDVAEKKDIQDGQLQMTLSESLIRVPGITAQIELSLHKIRKSPAVALAHAPALVCAASVFMLTVSLLQCRMAKASQA